MMLYTLSSFLLITLLQVETRPQNLAEKILKVPKTTGSNFSQIHQGETLPDVTCLFMVDLQSLGISEEAIETYQKFFQFAQLVAFKLNSASKFHGFLDTFGYSSGLNDHNTYPVFTYQNFKNIPYPIDDTQDDIDLSLKNVDNSLRAARWAPAATGQTCLVFFSAAPVSDYSNTSIHTTYDSFSTVVGVIIGSGVTSIPGLTDSVVASSLTDADAQAVVQKILRSIS